MSVINGQPVTVRNTPASNGDFRSVTAERETSAGRPETLHPPITEGEPSPGFWERLKARIEWPEPLAEKAPAADVLIEYARRAPWTSSQYGLIRFLGVVYCRAVVIPAVFGLRYADWVVRRPLRLAANLLVLKLATELPYVRDIADDAIKPCVNFALWLFL